MPDDRRRHKELIAWSRLTGSLDFGSLLVFLWRPGSDVGNGASMILNMSLAVSKESVRK